MDAKGTMNGAEYHNMRESGLLGKNVLGFIKTWTHWFSRVTSMSHLLMMSIFNADQHVIAFYSILSLQGTMNS